MSFRNVYLTDEEKEQWAKYFSEKYPNRKGIVGRPEVWSGMTINDDQTIFVRSSYTDPENYHLKDFFYYWNGYLFKMKMEQVWGEKDLEAWNVLWIGNYANYEPGDQGIQFDKVLQEHQEQIFQDLKKAMIVYGRSGGAKKNSNSLDNPIPNIQIKVGEKVY